MQISMLLAIICFVAAFFLVLYFATYVVAWVWHKVKLKYEPFFVKEQMKAFSNENQKEKGENDASS